MELLDIILILILAGFILWGFHFGLIAAIGSILGLILGVWGAGMYFEQMGEWLSHFLPIGGTLLKVLAFLIVFILFNRGVSLIFWFLGKIFELPILKILNKLLGAVLGLIEGILAIGIVLHVLSRYSFSESLDLAMINSVLSHWFVWVGNLLVPLLPEAVEVLKSVIV